MYGEYKNTKLFSTAKFNDVESVNFFPTAKVKLHKVGNKGERKFWKWLGFIPLIPYHLNEDRYDVIDCDVDGENDTLETIKSKLDREKIFINENGEIMRKAVVTVRFKPNANRWREDTYFESDSEAYQFLEDIKEKCENVGNSLC